MADLGWQQQQIGTARPMSIVIIPELSGRRMAETSGKTISRACMHAHAHAHMYMRRMAEARGRGSLVLASLRVATDMAGSTNG